MRGYLRLSPARYLATLAELAAAWPKQIGGNIGEIPTNLRGSPTPPSLVPPYSALSPTNPEEPMPQTAPRLLASAGTFDGITALVERFYGGPKTFEPTPEGWRIVGLRGAIPSVRVIRAKGRYRFEATDPR